MRKIFLIVNELKVTCGVTNSVYNFLKEILKVDKFDFYVICGGGDAINKFEELKVKVIVNNVFRHEDRSLLNFIKAHFVLLKLIRQYKPGIIHSHHHYAANIAQTIKKFSHVKTIMTNHGLLPEVGILSHFPADHIIAVNQHVVDYLVERKIKSENNIHLIPNGIIFHSYPPKIKREKIRFIAASRLVYDKGVDIYLNAVSLLSEEYRRKAEFYLAGEGDYLEDLLAMESRFNTGIKFLGQLENLRVFLNDSNVFIMPTRSTAEGFPITLIEAGYAKNLIITSDFKGLGYFFDFNNDGLVFKSGDSSDLAEKIKYVIDNHEKLMPKVESFYNKTINLFNVEAMVEKTCNLYNEILK